MAPEPKPEISATAENYLAIIFSIVRRKEPVTGARVAQRLQVSRASVLGMIRRMQRDGLVSVGPNKRILLTPLGNEAAARVVRRHVLAERFLVDILGMEWHRVHEEAHRVEHALSPQVEALLNERLGRPKTCPHGNPVPGNVDDLAPRGILLHQVASKSHVMVDNLSEELEDDQDAMDYLYEHGIGAGSRLKVLEVIAANETVLVESKKGEVPLGFRLAKEIRVEKV